MIIYRFLTAPVIASISSVFLFLASSIYLAKAQDLVDNKLPTGLVGLTWNQADYSTLDGFKIASDETSLVPGRQRGRGCDMVIRGLQLRKGDDVVSIDLFVCQDVSEKISDGLWGMLVNRYTNRIPKIESGVPGVRLHATDRDFIVIAGNLGFNISVRGRRQRVVDDSGNDVLETYSSVTEMEPLMRKMLEQVLVQNSRAEATDVSLIDGFKASPVVIKSESNEDISVISIAPSDKNPQWIPVFAESDDLVLSIKPGEILVHNPGTEDGKKGLVTVWSVGPNLLSVKKSLECNFDPSDNNSADRDPAFSARDRAYPRMNKLQEQFLDGEEQLIIEKLMKEGVLDPEVYYRRYLEEAERIIADRKVGAAKK